MANNIEIKAKANNFDRQIEIASDLCEQAGEILYQHDVFYNVSRGRLKLRRFPKNEKPGYAQLIFYQRSDHKGPKASEYHIYESNLAQSLHAVLEKAHGVKAEIKKKRLLFLYGRTRIHFDQVENLGEFIELEVVLDGNDSRELSVQQKEARIEAESLMERLLIRQEDLIEKAYVDLLINANSN